MEIKKLIPQPIKSLAKSVLSGAQNAVEFKKYHALYRKYRRFTMIPSAAFCTNLSIVHKFASIPGCVVECGTWRGGMIAAMADILGAERGYYLFDSFEGLPDAKEIDGQTAIAWQKDTTSPLYYNNCAAEVAYAEEAMSLSAASQYKILKGWFKDTLPPFEPNGPIAVLRLDGDWYESTMQCLDSLYHLVTKGGVIIIDDYYAWDGCAKAVHDFLSKHALAERIRVLDGVCYLIKVR